MEVISSIFILMISIIVSIIYVETSGNLLFGGNLFIVFLVLGLIIWLIMCFVFDKIDEKERKAAMEKTKREMAEKRKESIAIAQIKQIIADAVGKEVEQIKEDADFQKDLGFDSLDYFSMLVELENETGVEMEDGIWKDILSTVNEIIEYLRSNGKTVTE